MQGTKKRKDEDISSFQPNKALVRLKALGRYAFSIFGFIEGSNIY